MTVFDVYQTALSLLPSSHESDPTFLEYAVLWANMALAECYETENGIRIAEGRELLAAIPRVNDNGDQLPYSERLTRYAFPYFFASLMAKDDDDDYWATDYRARYIVALGEAAKLTQGSVVDVYGGE